MTTAKPQLPLIVIVCNGDSGRTRSALYLQVDESISRVKKQLLMGGDSSMTTRTSKATLSVGRIAFRNCNSKMLGRLRFALLAGVSAVALSSVGWVPQANAKDCTFPGQGNILNTADGSGTANGLFGGAVT